MSRVLRAAVLTAIAANIMACRTAQRLPLCDQAGLTADMRSRLTSVATTSTEPQTTIAVDVLDTVGPPLGRVIVRLNRLGERPIVVLGDAQRDLRIQVPYDTGRVVIDALSLGFRRLRDTLVLDGRPRVITLHLAVEWNAFCGPNGVGVL